MEFDNGLPIYQQIIDRLKAQILSGSPASGERLESVRDLSLRLGVSVNTLQKALAVLEQEGLLHTEGTNGRYVTRDGERLVRLKEDTLTAELNRFLNKMRAMGFTDSEIARALPKTEAKENQ